MRCMLNIFFSPPPALPMTTFCTFPSLPTHIWNFFFSFSSRYWVQFVLAVLEAMPALACGQPTRGHIVKQNWLSPSSFQINANSSPASGGDFVPASVSPFWDFIWLTLGQVLCTLLQSLWGQMCNCLVVSGTHCFLWCYPSKTYGS